MIKRASSTVEIGSARAKPGEIVYGVFDAMGLPTGGMESFPVIIAQGKRDGPTLWLTAGIHGDEFTGLQVIYRLIQPELAARMQGTLVAIPALNPAGLRISQRTPYYMHKQDPNRLFPTWAPKMPLREMVPPLEAAYMRLFDRIRATANYLIDLHSYSIQSIPFAFRDPVYYRDDRERASAQSLLNRVTDLLNAFGFTIVNEFASAEYLKKSLHRSVSGATLHIGNIPAFTLEIGGYLTVDPVIVQAACAGTRNAMRHIGMLTDAPEPITGVPVIKLDYPVRRTQHPHAPQSGMFRHLVRPGEFVRRGDPVSQMTDIYGRPIGPDGGMVRTEYDGFVLGLSQGMAFYQNDVLMTLAIRDDMPSVLPYPG